MDSHPGAGDAAAHALQLEGHEVVRCRDPYSPAHPCAGFEGECPIDLHPVDVALDVRSHPLPRPTAGEHGVVCASRAGIPIVVAGQVAFQPFERLTSVELAGTGRVAAACETAVANAAEAGCAKVSDAIRAATGLDAAVERDGSSLIVTVQDAEAAGPAAVATHQAVRSVDRDARTVSIRTG